jgi:hypothetical protein
VTQLEQHLTQREHCSSLAVVGWRWFALAERVITFTPHHVTGEEAQGIMVEVELLSFIQSIINQSPMPSIARSISSCIHPIPSHPYTKIPGVDKKQPESKKSAILPRRDNQIGSSP